MNTFRVVVAVAALALPAIAASPVAPKITPEQRWNELEKSLTEATPIEAKNYTGKRVKLVGGYDSDHPKEMHLSTRVDDPAAVIIRVRKTIREVGRVARWPAFIKLIGVEGVILSINAEKREVVVDPTKATLLHAL